MGPLWHRGHFGQGREALTVVDLGRIVGMDRRLKSGGLVNRATIEPWCAGRCARRRIGGQPARRQGGRPYRPGRVLPVARAAVAVRSRVLLRDLTASAYFLAADHGRDRRLRPTLSMMAIAGWLSLLAWVACAVPFHAISSVYFNYLVVLMAVVVITQLCTVTAKGCCQGSGDINGANLVIVAEELWFVFTFPVVLFALETGALPRWYLP